MAIVQISPEDFIKHYEREEKMRRRIVFDDYGVTIKGLYDYDIEWGRIDTPLKLLGWLRHLSSKSWMDLAQLMIFAEEVCKHKNWQLGV